MAPLSFPRSLQPWTEVYELLDGRVVRRPWLKFCRPEYAFKAARRMLKKNPHRRLWLEGA